MTETISIAGLDKAKVLAALYNNSRPLGLGHLHFTPEPMKEEEARALLAQQADDERGAYFDYLKGRVMKVRIGGDELNPSLYDRDNGDGAAARVIDALRSESKAA